MNTPLPLTFFNYWTQSVLLTEDCKTGLLVQRTEGKLDPS